MQIDLYNAVKAGEKYLPGKKATMQLTVDAFLDGVQNGRWESEVLNFRAGRLPKIGLPAATPSGTFSTRGASNLIQHSGFIVLDFDAKDNENFPAVAPITVCIGVRYSNSLSNACLWASSKISRLNDWKKR